MTAERMKTPMVAGLVRDSSERLKGTLDRLPSPGVSPSSCIAKLGTISRSAGQQDGRDDGRDSRVVS